MNERPLVSVCMPCHNAAPYLRAALDSVLAQTYPNVEIVAVDDGSTDETGAILDDYAARRGIRAIHQANAGQCAAANRAFAESRGAFIKFLDADDLISPESVSLQLDRLRGEPECVASARWGRFYGEPDDSDFAPEPVWRDMTPIDWLVESMWDRLNMMQCGIWLIPRSVLGRSGLWDERLSLVNDLDFIPRVLVASKGVRFTDAKLYYRSGVPGSLSARKSRRAYESATSAVEGCCRTILAAEDSARTRKVCADLAQHWYFEIAPHHPDLGGRLRDQVARLGGSQVRPTGGPVFRRLAGVIGWRAAAKLRAISIERGYGRLRSRLVGRRTPARPR